MESFVFFFYFIVLALPITAISVIIIIIVERTIFCKYFRFLTLFSKALYKCEVWVLVKIQVTEVTFYCTLETRKLPFNHAFPGSSFKSLVTCSMLQTKIGQCVPMARNKIYLKKHYSMYQKLEVHRLII